MIHLELFCTQNSSTKFEIDILLCIPYLRHLSTFESFNSSLSFLPFLSLPRSTSPILSHHTHKHRPTTPLLYSTNQCAVFIFKPCCVYLPMYFSFMVSCINFIDSSSTCNQDNDSINFGLPYSYTTPGNRDKIWQL